MIKELRNNKTTFKVMKNEMTYREFISPFLVMAVTCLQREEKSLILQAEEELDGTHAYGPGLYN